MQLVLRVSSSCGYCLSLPVVHELEGIQRVVQINYAAVHSLDGVSWAQLGRVRIEIRREVGLEGAMGSTEGEESCHMLHQGFLCLKGFLFARFCYEDATTLHGDSEFSFVSGKAGG